MTIDSYIENLGISLEKWPLCVPKYLLVQNEDDKFERASQILEIILDNEAINKKFLDFGCGEGHLANLATKTAKSSTGYDPNPVDNDIWQNQNNYTISDNFDKISENAPYEVVIAHDVIDHTADPINTLKQIRSLCDSNTKVFIRCHPFISRHGGHLYNKANLAYLHLVLTPEELKEIEAPLDTDLTKVSYPISEYHHLFDHVGFEIKTSNLDVSNIEKFFLEPNIISRIKANTNIDNMFLPLQMKVNFYDFILSTGPKKTQTLEAVNTVSLCNHYVDNQLVAKHHFFTNGKINDINSADNWEVNNNNIIMKWQNLNAPDGWWVDQCAINDMSYHGKNQSGNTIQGTFTLE